jgi:hypothetical protein
LVSAAGLPEESCVEQEADGGRAEATSERGIEKQFRVRVNLALLPEPGLK